jgi:asparagine synthase (glutamine-hydrolysing)
MCGIAGVFVKKNINQTELQNVLQQMALAIKYRGPDSSGEWLDPDLNFGLAHRRLSILDLSPEGHQPMLSASGRYVIAFNGEVYNYVRLKKQLPEQQWRGHSDTEVMLAAIEAWGLEKALHSFQGMFAFALWDRKEKILHLARDRVGIKPLYYGWNNSAFLFGSELKCFRTYKNFHAEIDRDALALFVRHNYIPAPYSIYKDVWKLQPGHVISLTFSDVTNPHIIENKSYWSGKGIAESGQRDFHPATEHQLINELDGLLSEVIDMHMHADVPLGAFLSGGIDSSTVVAFMQKLSARPIQTFSIGFHEAEFNEADHAKKIATYLKTDHTELYVSPQQALQVIPHLPMLYDEPFADSSQVPTFLVSQLARRKVTVSLSGDGGDELFGGYNRYFLGDAIWKKIGWLPPLAKKIVEKSVVSLSPDAWDKAFSVLKPILPAKLKFNAFGDKLHKLAGILGAVTPMQLYECLVSIWQQPEAVVLGAERSRATSLSTLSMGGSLDFVHAMMCADMLTYLPDDILVKVDRASMAVSLEARVPFLDHRIIEFAWRLPLQMKIRGGEGKWLLKQVLYQHVPEKFFARPKMGFGVPIGEWLRGPLRDWAESLLASERLAREGFFNVNLVRQCWQEHLSGKRNWQYALWTILMFQAWLENK